MDQIYVRILDSITIFYTINTICVGVAECAHTFFRISTKKISKVFLIHCKLSENKKNCFFAVFWGDQKVRHIAMHCAPRTQATLKGPALLGLNLFYIKLKSTRKVTKAAS